MAKVTFKRVETDEEASNIPFVDGQLIYTGDGKSYMDYGFGRVPINGTPDNTMSDSSSRPVENRTIKSYVDTQISNLFIPSSKIIWENPNPTTAFAGQTINLTESLDNYDSYEIIFLQDIGYSRTMSTGVLPVGCGTILMIVMGSPVYRATTSEVSGTTITFENGKRLTAIGATEQVNSVAVPLYVIGHHTGLEFN